MNIKILGPGCARCHQLEKTTSEVVKELGVDAEGVARQVEEALSKVSKLANTPEQIFATPRVAEMIKRASDEADRLKDEFVGTEHLLVAILAEPRGESADILRRSEVKSITVAHMEVPCCMGLVHLARQAITASGKNVPLKEVAISARGEILD